MPSCFRASIAIAIAFLDFKDQVILKKRKRLILNFNLNSGTVITLIGKPSIEKRIFFCTSFIKGGGRSTGFHTFIFSSKTRKGNKRNRLS